MDDEAAQEVPPGIPAWVKALGGLVLLALAVLLALHLTGTSPRH